jgi:hypothetical protein
MDLLLKESKMNADTDRCPWCGSVIAHAKFVEIETKIREQQEKKLAEAEAALHKRLEEKFERDLETQKRAAEKLATQEAGKLVAKASSEKSVALEKLKQVEAREATILKQVQEEAEKRKQLKQKFQRDLALTKLAADKQAKEESEKRVASVAAERDLAVQKAKQLEAKEATVRKELQEQAERQMQKELNEQRAILEKARDQDVLKKQVEFNREREGWQKKMLEFEKKLQQKTANEIGEGAEVDVYEVLREAFPHDHITRVAKGQPGADIHHEIIYKGESCGRIILDSKNRQAWQNSYITKLRQDQTEAGAEAAILATTVFPSGKKELCNESGVIVVNPARAVHIVSLLRNHMIRMHVLGLSAKERGGKMNQLYKFITSEGYSQRFTEATKLTDDILELDVKEKKDHDNLWKKRGTLATRLNHVLRELDTEISAIVESGVGSEVPAA